MECCDTITAFNSVASASRSINSQQKSAFAWRKHEEE
jgi:hypothetical protein